ncbi:MAG: serine/threonine-protein kinase, partial [Deltaproteobacteria bacterium]|nr:serine/threonine-protein kinase [Deltaproteobacteria bacterium]
MEGSDAPGVAAGAEAAFASYLALVKRGEIVDFDAFCSERPALADSLRVLFHSWSAARRPPSRGQSIREFLSQEESRPRIDLDDEAPAEDPGSGVRERLAQIASRSGRYTLREEIARGGMGVILRVWDKDLRRTLAMKASFESITDKEPSETTAESVSRFEDEEQITSQLDHPGIVPVHEIGVDDEGRVYFTMLLVKGKTLDQVIRLARTEEEGWTRAGAIGVMVKVCEAMAFAHAKGVIHRDLKPANVMVGKFGEVYVMDWGLAKVIGQRGRLPRLLEASILRTQVRTDRLDDQSDGSPLATMEGAIIGTPTYMPPEQAEGRIDDLDQRSDVYSVGALLYTLLTGRMPYVDPDNPPGAAQVVMSLIKGPPEPVLELDKTVVPELVAICEKAMSRAPGDRYATMVEMAEDLSAFVENRVVRAYRTGAAAELRKWVGRNRVIATMLAALVFLVIGGSVFFAWQQSERYAEVSAANE